MDRNHDTSQRRKESYKSRGSFQERRNKRQEVLVSLRKDKRYDRLNSLRCLDIPPITLAELIQSDSSLVAYNSEVITRFMTDCEKLTPNHKEIDGEPYPIWTKSPDVIYALNELFQRDLDGGFAEKICSKGLLSPILTTSAKHKKVYSDDGKRAALASIISKLTPKYINLLINSDRGIAVTLLMAFLMPTDKPISVCASLDALRSIADVAAPPLLQQGLLHSLNFVLSNKQAPNEVLIRVAAILEVISLPKTLAKETSEAFPVFPPLSPLEIHHQIVCLIHKLLLSPQAMNAVIQSTLAITLGFLQNFDDIEDCEKTEFFFTPTFFKSHPVLIRLVDFIGFPIDIASLAIKLLAALTYNSNMSLSEQYIFYEGILETRFVEKLIVCLDRIENFSSFPNQECLAFIGRIVSQGEGETSLIVHQDHIVKYVLRCVQSSPTVATEAIWLLGIIAENITEHEVYDFLENYTVIRGLCDLLTLSQNADVLGWALQALEAFFTHGSESLMVYLKQSIEACGGLEKIDSLSLNHLNEKVRSEAANLADILSGKISSDCDSDYDDYYEDSDPIACSIVDLSRHRRSTSLNSASVTSESDTASVSFSSADDDIVYTTVHFDEFDFYG